MCIITIIRLVLSIHLNLDDFTYEVLKLTIVTSLEPLLGIVIACLPFFPPVIRKIAAYYRNNKIKTRNVLSSSIARLRAKRSSAFRSIDDSFPLPDLEEAKTQNHITGPSRKHDHDFGGYGQFAVAANYPQSVIVVAQDWEVRSDEARHLAEKV